MISISVIQTGTHGYFNPRDYILIDPGSFMILIQKRYKDTADEIKEEDIDLVKLNLTITRKICCGGRDKKDYDLGWVEKPGDMKLTTVRDYRIVDRVLEVWIEP